MLTVVDEDGSFDTGLLPQGSTSGLGYIRGCSSSKQSGLETIAVMLMLVRDFQINAYEEMLLHNYIPLLQKKTYNF